MSESAKKVQRVYRHLVEGVIPHKKVVSYGSVSAATHVPLGKDGGGVAKALDIIFLRCDQQKLPPLPSIVVQEGGIYDKDGRHGMPGGGYLVAEACSVCHNKDRMHRKGIEKWSRVPRPPDTESWTMKDMIEEHQRSVWDLPPGQWPEEL